ncbi:MAG: TonB-dependent receptor [Pseudomonadota bacterium]
MDPFKNRLLTPLACVVSLAVTDMAMAQDSADDSSRLMLEEIIVTAQRREQSIQDVANSIQAFSGEEMDILNQVSMEDYVNSIGGAGFTQSGNGAIKIGIRGVSALTQDEYAFASSTSTTGLYLNDVAIQGGGSLPNLDLYDLNRIEVLKGPQGTLYGEGAMGGAIKMILNSPNLSEFEAKAEATVMDTENADLGYRVRGAINVPIIEDRLAARIVGTTQDTPGWIDNVATGEDGVNDSDSWSLRGLFLWQFTEAFSGELLLMHDEVDTDGYANERIGLGDLETDLLSDEYNEAEFDLYALTFTYEFDFAQFTSVSSYYETERQFRQHTPIGYDTFILAPAFGPQGWADDEVLDVYQEVETFAQELRLVSAGDEILDWTIGAFYRDRDREYCTRYDTVAALGTNEFLESIGLGSQAFPETQFDCPAQTLSGLDIANREGSETFEQTAVYGEINWEFAEDFELTVGLRWFDEEVEFTDLQESFGLLSFLSIPSSSDSTSESDVLPKVGVSWTPTDDQLYYVNIAEGFRSGGSNLNAALTFEPGRFQSYESDGLINYELGAKTTWDQGRLTLNGVLFYTDWTDIQAFLTVPNIVGNTTQVLAAGGDGEILGLEVELNYQPTANWATGLLFTVQEAEFTDPAEEANVVPDSQLPNAPDLTATVFAQYSQSLDHGDLFARIEYRYVDDQRTVVEPLVPIPPFGPDIEPYDDDSTILDSYDLLNLTVGLYADSWYFSGFVHNLTDERYELDRAFGELALNPNLNSLGRPRTYGLTVGINF